VWRLAYPAILTMVSQTIMWTVDAAMVGHVGKTELAAVGLGGILIWTLYSFFIGLTSAVNTFVAQSHGAGELRKCGVYLWQGLYLSLAAAALVFAVRAFVPEIMSLLRPDPAVQAEAAGYIRIRMLSVPFFLAHHTYADFYRGIGDTRTPLKVLVFAHALNVVGDYALIFGKGPFPALGVDGAAWATSLANVVAAVIFAVLLARKAMRRRYGTLEGVRPRRAETVRLLRVGLPIAAHFFLDMGSFLVFSAYIGRMGTDALAANQIAIQVLALSFMPAQGFAVAATTLVGQYVGAGRPDLAQRCAYRSILLGLAYAGFIAALCWTLPGPLVRVFNSDATVVALGMKLLLLAGLFQAFDAVQFIADGALRGAGDTRVPMLIIVGGAWFVFLPTAWLLGSVLERGVVGAWVGALLYITVVGALMFARLRAGRWRSIVLDR
jgi:MATE family multidrug resistance protein